MFCCSVAKSCPTSCDPMDCSTPGLPVLPCLLEFAQTHVHRVGDAIQPFYPLSPPSPSAFSLSQHLGLFQWVDSLHQVAKVLELRFSISPSNDYSGLITFRIDWFNFLAVQETLKSLLQHCTLKASVHQYVLKSSTINWPETSFHWTSILLNLCSVLGARCQTDHSYLPCDTETPRWLDGKESACQCGDSGLIPGLERFPWRRKWQPTPVFLPGESHGERSLAGYSSWSGKSLTQWSDWTHRKLDLIMWKGIWKYFIPNLGLFPAGHRSDRQGDVLWDWPPGFESWLYSSNTFDLSVPWLPHL